MCSVRRPNPMPITNPIVHLFDTHICGYFLRHLQGVMLKPPCRSDLKRLIGVMPIFGMKNVGKSKNWLPSDSYQSLKKFTFLGTLGFAKCWHQTNKP